MDDKELIKMLVEVIEDFMPNIGRCALQDYERLNTALMEADSRLLCPAYKRLYQDDEEEESESLEDIARAENKVLDAQEHSHNKRSKL